MTVTASQALVAKWLLPHLEDFSALHPRVDVRLDVTDRIVDLLHGEADLAVRCGGGGWPGLEAVRLMGEHVIAVCSPRLQPPAPPEPLDGWVAKQTLIHDLSPASAAVLPTWAEWLTRAGLGAVPAGKDLRINAAAAVIQAALRGQGIALVRAALVADDLAEGRLIRLAPGLHWPIAWSYYAVASRKALARPEVQAFHDWLLALPREAQPHTR